MITKERVEEILKGVRLHLRGLHRSYYTPGEFYANITGFPFEGEVKTIFFDGSEEDFCRALEELLDNSVSPVKFSTISRKAV